MFVVLERSHTMSVESSAGNDGSRPRFRFVQRQAFLTVQPTDEPHRWTLPVEPELCTGGGFLFGGCALGACIEALERTTGRPLIWATGQYLSYAQPPSVLDIDVAIPVTGRAVTQARATGHVGETEILTVNAALGHRSFHVEGTFATMPEVAAPDDCPVRKGRVETGSVNVHLDQRLAIGQPIFIDGEEEMRMDPVPGGRSAIWIRIEDMPETTAAKLGVLGDYVAFGSAQAFGRPIGGNSLDNTLRVVRLVPTEWVLLDVQFQALGDGFGHGQVLLWAEDGTLLGIASQSMIARDHAAMSR
jgi:acyl-CoA thioesterase